MILSPIFSYHNNWLHFQHLHILFCARFGSTCTNICVSHFIIFIYLKSRVTVMRGSRRRKIVHSLVHPSNGCNHWGLAEPEVYIFIWVSHVSGRALRTWTIVCSFTRHNSRKMDLNCTTDTNHCPFRMLHCRYQLNPLHQNVCPPTFV